MFQAPFALGLTCSLSGPGDPDSSPPTRHCKGIHFFPLSLLHRPPLPPHRAAIRQYQEVSLHNKDIHRHDLFWRILEGKGGIILQTFPFPTPPWRFLLEETKTRFPFQDPLTPPLKAASSLKPAELLERGEHPLRKRVLGRWNVAHRSHKQAWRELRPRHFIPCQLHLTQKLR